MERYFKESIDLMSVVLRDKEILGALEECADAVARCFRRGNKLLIAGNGGSAADAQHFAAELVCRYKKDRKPYPALALNVDTSVLTAWINDVSVDTVFSRQIEAFGKQGDIFIGITTSGNSTNVVEAVKTAKEMGLETICFLGKGGGKLKGACDQELIVPSDNVPRIQEVHQVFFHSICEEVERTLSEEAEVKLRQATEREPA